MITGLKRCAGRGTWKGRGFRVLGATNRRLPFPRTLSPPGRVLRRLSFAVGSALSPLMGMQGLVSLGTRPHQEPSRAAHGRRDCRCSCHPGHDKGFGSSVPGTRAETNPYKFCYLTVTSFPIPRSLSGWSRGLGAVPSAPARRSPRSVSWAGGWVVSHL